MLLLGTLRPDTLTVVQIAVTVAILSGYAFAVARRQPQLYASGHRQMTLLVSFVAANHIPPVAVYDLVVPPGPGSKTTSQGPRDHRLVRAVHDNARTGELVHPLYPPGRTHNAGDALAALIGGPLFAVVVYFLELWGVTKRPHFYVPLHTDDRRADISTWFVALASTLIYLALPMWMFTVWHGRLAAIVCDTLTVLLFITVLFAVAGITAEVRQQVRWKDYWQEKLQTVMGHANATHNHDVFNRALLLSREVRAEPNLPIPGTLATYATFYGAVQAVILWTSHHM